MDRYRTRRAMDVTGLRLGTSVGGAYVPATPVYMPTYTPSLEYTEDSRHPRHPYEGGPFERLYSELSFPSMSRTKCGTDYMYNSIRTCSYYEGAIYAAFGPMPTMPTSRKEEAKSYGPEGWAKASPLKPDVGLGQFFAEIKEQPRAVYRAVSAFRDVFRRGRRVWLSKPRTPMSTIRCFGKEYLGYYFGWVPFVKDLDAWYQSYLDLDRRVANLRNNNCKWQRRRSTVFTNVTETRTQNYSTSIIKPNLPYGFYSLTKGEDITITSSECWFSGKMKYYIPHLDSPTWGRAKALQKLWGLELTPSLAYELMPFSWLIDWFTGFGRMVDTITQITMDHLTAQYAYIMLHKLTEKRREVSCKTKLTTSRDGLSYYWTSHSMIARSMQESKTRVEAGPFGFDLSVSLSEWQLSILAALGLTKLR